MEKRRLLVARVCCLLIHLPSIFLLFVCQLTKSVVSLLFCVCDTFHLDHDKDKTMNNLYRNVYSYHVISAIYNSYSICHLICFF